MAHIVVSTTIDATPSEVWSYVESIASHVDWMADAEEIRFLSDQTSGVGTKFECDTRIGPLTTTDVMEITAWEPGARMGVDHIGLVHGRGDFFLSDNGNGTTKFFWDEDISFPWFLGGPIGEFFGKPILTLVWKRNLSKLSEQVTSFLQDASMRAS